MLKVRPHTKSGRGGGGASGPIYEKWGGGASGPIYEKWGGGGGGGGGVGAIPLQVQYFWAHRKYLHVPHVDIFLWKPPT